MLNCNRLQFNICEQTIQFDCEVCKFEYRFDKSKTTISNKIQILIQLFIMKQINRFFKITFVIVLVFSVSFASKSYAAAISAAQSGDWSVASTWTGGIIPTIADDVTITGFTVTISTNDAVAQSVIVETSATTVGKLIVQASGLLTVSSAASALTIKGGEVENAGSINLTTTGSASNCISFANTTASMLINSGKYSGAGSLTLNAAAASSGSAISMTQSQTTGTSPNVVYYGAVFVVGGTYTVSVASGRPVFGVGIGRHTIDGTGSMSFGTVESPVSHGLIMITVDFGRLTINPNVTLSIVSNMVVDKRGPVYFHNIPNATITNKGTININGSGNNAIGVAPGTNANQSFVNEGTVSIAGAYQQAYIGINSTTTASLTFTNTGTFTIDATGTTVPILSAFGTNNKIIFNNNTNGVFSVNTGNTTILTSARAAIINSGGTLKASGILNGTLDASTGTIQPGGTAIGKLTVSQLQSSAVNTNNLTGKLLMDVNGKSTAGTNFDQIAFSQSTVNVAGATLEANLGGSYSPGFGDEVALISAVAQSGNFSATTLPANASLVYTVPTAISLTFGSTDVKDTQLADMRVVGVNGQVIIGNSLNKQINIYSIDGRLLFSEYVKSTNKSVELRSGLYILEAPNYRQKFIVK